MKGKKPDHVRGLFQAIYYHPPAEAPDGEYPFYLTTGTIFTHYPTSAMTRRCATLKYENYGVFIEISDRHLKKILCTDKSLV